MRKKMNYKIIDQKHIIARAFSAFWKKELRILRKVE